MHCQRSAALRVPGDTRVVAPPLRKALNVYPYGCTVNSTLDIFWNSTLEKRGETLYVPGYRNIGIDFVLGA